MTDQHITTTSSDTLDSVSDIAAQQVSRTWLDEELSTLSDPSTVICGINFQKPFAVRTLKHMSYMRGVVLKSVALIDEHNMTEPPNPSDWRDVLADEFPDPTELAAVDARCVVAMHTIRLSEGFDKCTGFDGMLTSPNEVKESLPATSLWIQVFYVMVNVKASRNYFAYSFCYPSDEDERVFAELRQAYSTIITALAALIEKFKAALGGESAWKKWTLEGWPVAGRPDYGKDCPEAEAIWLEREAKENAALDFMQKAKQKWAEKVPGTEKYAFEAAYVRFTWLEHQGIKLMYDSEFEVEYPEDGSDERDSEIEEFKPPADDFMDFAWNVDDSDDSIW